MTSIDGNEREIYSRMHRPMTRLLHWSVFALVVVAAGAMVTRAYVDSSLQRKLLLSIHQSVGLAVLGLTLLRLAWRRFARVGARHNSMSPLIRIGATATHAALYITLLVLTVLGWLTADAFGRSPRFLGAIPLPALIGRDRALGDELQAWHGDLAWLLLALVLAHIAAALWHHFWHRDDVLRSMAPFGLRLDANSRAGTGWAAAHSDEPLGDADADSAHGYPTVRLSKTN